MPETKELRQMKLINHEIEQLIRKAALALADSGAREVYLFGSAVRGAISEDSDIDIAVSGLPPEKFFEAMRRAANILQRPLDLVDLDEKNLFTDYLKKKGKLQRVA